MEPHATLYMEYNRNDRLALLRDRYPRTYKLYKDFDTFAEQLCKEFGEVDLERRYE